MRDTRYGATAKATRFYYRRGWGDKSLGAKPVVCSWTLNIADLRGNPTTLTFELFDEDSPLSVGLNDKQCSVTDLLSATPTLTLARPQDRMHRTIPIYLDDVGTEGTHGQLKRRLLLDVVGFRTAASLPASSVSTPRTNMRPTTLGKRIHRYSHAPVGETKRLLALAGMLTPELAEEVDQVAANCDICAMSGQPKPSRKVSLNQVDERFNNHLQE